MTTLKFIKTFEAYGTNYSVENWSDFITFLIKSNITPDDIQKGKSGGIYSKVFAVKSHISDIERYFTKNSFYTFPVKYIRLNFKIELTNNTNRIYAASFTGQDDDIVMDKFNAFNNKYDTPTMKTMEISYSINSTNLNWEAFHNTSEFWEKFDELNSITQHEVHHAYEEYQMKLKGVNPYKTKDSKLDNIIRNIWHEFPDTQLITKFIYLLTSHEINARITQLYSILKRKNIETKDEFFKAIEKTITWKDYMILKNYEPSDYITVFKKSFNDEETEIFLSLWNKYADGNFPTFNSIEKFFEYWKPKTEHKAIKMKNKILKVWSLINQN